MSMTADSQVGEAEPARPAYVQKYMEPAPPVPVALRGCWETDFDPDWPDAGKARVTIHADRIVKVSEGEPMRVATPRETQAVTETSMDAVFAAPEGDIMVTVATSLSLGPDDLGTAAGKLRLAEGDAGSYSLSRCR